MTEMFHVSIKDLPKYWKEASEYLGPAIKITDNRSSLDTVKEALLDGRMSLWVIYEGEEMLAAVITDLVRYPLKQVLTLPYVGGRHAKKWIHHMDTFEKLARDAGCEEIEFFARRGWIKLFPDYNEYYTSLRKEL